MFSHTPTSSKILNLLFLALFVSIPNLLSAQVKSRWTTTPSYETAGSHSTALVIKDTAGILHTLYSESHAVLIIEGNYRQPSWDNVSEPGERNEKLLVKRLESRGFQVVVWRDLTGSQLDTTLKEVRDNFGYIQNSRLFLYFYGHGYKLKISPDSDETRTFLIPIDTPNPVKNEAEFYRVALPITQLLELSKQITVKHSFFALEACKSGAITSSLDDFFDFPRPLGYLLSQEILNPDHKILTAASQNEDILADSPFTPLLAAALEFGDSNHDGYVTGSEVVSFVKERLPQVTQAITRQTPQVMWFPLADGGDFIFGPAMPGSTATLAIPRTPVAVTPKPERATPPPPPDLRSNPPSNEVPAAAHKPPPDQPGKPVDNETQTKGAIRLELGKVSGVIEGTVSDPNHMSSLTPTYLS